MIKESISIKGTKQGLVILLNENRELDDLKKNLRYKIEAAKGFFRGARFNFYSGRTECTLSENEKLELEAICLQHGLIPDSSITYPLRPGTVTKPKSENVFPSLQGLPVEGAALIHKNIRSGQKLNYNRHVVIIGDVHAGAEVVSNGHIIILGALKGIAHAGAAGNTKARVHAFDLNPVQLRIGDCLYYAQYRPKKEDTFPQMAYLKRNEIVIEPWRI